MTWKMIKENLEHINSSIPESVTLVAVSKTKPKEILLEAYEAGQRIFGENKVPELAEKFEALPKDIEWHMIGHLQRNKVKYIAPFVKLIHAVDSLRLLSEINKQAIKNNRKINFLLQFHIAEESSKFGFDIEEVQELLQSKDFLAFGNVNCVGVMGMATFTDNTEQVRNEFKTLKKHFTTLKEGCFKNKKDFETISMGMSGDYQIAIEEGSNMVRVGSSIFGARS
jgi:pyridoxal phosphate enzyme (YggS family)